MAKIDGHLSAGVLHLGIGGAAFWVFFSGALMLPLPAFLGWQMPAVATVVDMLIPAFGFFLATPIGIYIVGADRCESRA